MEKITRRSRRVESVLDKADTSKKEANQKVKELEKNRWIRKKSNNIYFPKIVFYS